MGSRARPTFRVPSRPTTENRVSPMANEWQVYAPQGGYSNFCWATSGSLIVSFSHPGNIPIARFAEFLDTLRSDSQLKHVLVVSVGSAPIDSVQRKSLADTVRDRDMKVAVVLDNAFTRGILTALSWLGVKIKTFDPAKERDAISHLGFPDTEFDRIVQAIDQLRKITAPPK
jgi:hypothetical protein